MWKVVSLWVLRKILSDKTPPQDLVLHTHKKKFFRTVDLLDGVELRHCSFLDDSGVEHRVDGFSQMSELVRGGRGVEALLHCKVRLEGSAGRKYPNDRLNFAQSS